MKTKYDQYWYFRTEADEDDDTSVVTSVMVALDQITSIMPTGTDTLDIYFRPSTSENSKPEITTNRNGYVTLAITAGTTESVMRALVADINAGPRHKPNGVTTIADDSTIDTDESTRNPIYIHSGITGVTNLNLR
jgi:hypothetical protein